MGQGLRGHPGRVCQEERGLAGRSKRVKVRERIDGRRGSQSDGDIQEVVASAVESSESGGVGAVAVKFLSQVIPKSTFLISYPF